MNKGSLPNLSIFEAEALLLEALNLLKAPGRLELIKAKLVGDYWESGWRRAPFEECLTFKQLASIQYDTLIRKRSLDVEKMTALSYAIRKALTGAAPSEPTPPTLDLRPAPAPAELEQPRFTPAPSATPVFETPAQLLKDLAPSAAALYRGLREIIYEIPETHPLSRALRRIITDAPAPEFTAYWVSTVHGQTLATELLSLTDTKIARLIKAAQKVIEKAVQEDAPDAVLHWSTALTGAGASIGHLTRAYTHSRGVNASFMETACRVLLSSIGAQHVVLSSGPLQNHLSFSPATAGKILSALKLPTRSSLSKVQDTLSLPFPFFDLAELTEAIRASARKKPSRRR